MRRLALFGLIACLFNLPALAAPLDLVVIGDTPYTAEDEPMMAAATDAIKLMNPPFVLHVGDMQSSKAVCGPPDDRFAAQIAALAPIPVIYTPGDNDWTDCDTKIDPTTGKHVSELGRLSTLRRKFFARPAITDPTYHYVQQAGAPENARFEHAGMTFVTLNVAGTNNGRDLVMGDDLALAARAAAERDTADLNWLKQAFATARRSKSAALVVVMQADLTHLPRTSVGVLCRDAIADESRPCDGYAGLRKALIKGARTFARPVLLIHGDTAPFIMTRGIFTGDSDNIWRLNGAGDVGVNKLGQPQGLRDVTHVTLDPSAAIPIKAEGLLTHQIPEWLPPVWSPPEP
jgi:hypothetical protein